MTFIAPNLDVTPSSISNQPAGVAGQITLTAKIKDAPIPAIAPCSWLPNLSPLPKGFTLTANADNTAVLAWDSSHVVDEVDVISIVVTDADGRKGFVTY